MLSLAHNQNLTITSYSLWLQLNDFRVSDGSSKIRHDDFLARVVDECENLGVCETFAHPQNKQPVKFYNLTTEQALLVGMRESKSVRKKVLAWIKNLEQKAAPQIPQTYAEALQLAADQAKQLELAAPKVAFVDNLVNRDNLLNASQVGAKHKLSAVKLNKILDELGVYNKAIKRGRVFQTWFIEKGLGEMKKTDQGFDQALFTNKGEVWVNEKLFSEGVI